MVFSHGINTKGRRDCRNGRFRDRDVTENSVTNGRYGPLYEFCPSRHVPGVRYVMPGSGTDRYIHDSRRFDRDLSPKRSVFAFKGPFTGKNKAKMLHFWT